MATTTYDVYGRGGTQDAGSPTPPGAPVAGAGNAQVVYIHRGTLAAGAGTTKDTVINVGYKARVIDAWVTVTTGVASSTVQLFTAASGGGTALSSAISTATGGTIRNNMANATGVIAAGGSVYAYASGGATLPGVEICILLTPEQ